MHRHRLLTVAIAAAALAACTPSINSVGNPASSDYLLFDPAVPEIPLPNDLALQSAATQQGAQGELLQSFVAQGGFPNDQETPVTIDAQHYAYSDSTTTKSPAPVDPATLVLFAPGVTNATIAFFERKLDPATKQLGPPGPPEHPVTVSYVQSADRGTITIQNSSHPVTLSPGNVIQSRRWNAGSQYIVLVRGGAGGVKLTGGGPLTAQPTMYFLTRGVDLTKPENQYLLPGDGRAGRAQTGAQLEALRQKYLPLFGLAEQLFGPGSTKDLLSVQTFTIAPPKAGAAVVTDASAGIVPLPSDLLLDPTTNKIVKNPAFCSGQVDPKTGSCALADGLATLDGFSTTAMILSQTSAPVAVSTITKDTVFLYDLSTTPPTRVKEFKENLPTGVGTGFLAEPYQITYKADGSSCATLPAPDPACVISPAIGLQPAVPIPLSATGPFATLPPLKEGTEYAVLVTDGVKDPSGNALQSSTLSRILLFENPLVDANGKSQVPGQSDATAAGLEKIRQGVAAAAQAQGIAKSHIVLGYTFRTQTISQPALRLAAAPNQQAAKFVPSAPADVTPQVKALATSKSIPTDAVQAFWQVPLFTQNPIDLATGALNPDATKWTDSSLTALVAVPAAKQGAPLVVFQHGLTGDKANMVAIANTLTSFGFVVAAIDAPLHGDRAYCTADADCVCTGPGCTIPKCTFFGPAGLQGDSSQIGQCSGGSVACNGTLVDVAHACTTSVSGKFFISANLFRTRDALRQSILDTSAVVLALAPPSVPSNPFASQLAAAGVTIDPSKVYWVGHSLGGIIGTLATAANPRISEAVLNVPGGTLTDVFTQSPTIGPQLAPSLANLGITPGTPQYLQFLQIAKLILDGGDPINFAGHLTGDAAHPTLPDLLANKPNQSAKHVLVQVARGDTVIPNPFNYELAGNVFTSPQPDLTQLKSNVCTYTGTGDVTFAHRFLLDPTWSAAATVAGQGDAAAFLVDPVNNLPPAGR